MSKKRNLKKAAAGYGMAMLMVFLGTTVMLGASLQMMSVPLTMAYLGGVSQNNLSAKQLAEVGMNQVVMDLQSRYENRQTIDGTYSFTSGANAPSSVLMPLSPDAVTGAANAVGSYSASLPYINGNTVLARVTATVGSGTYTLNRLVTLNQNIYSTITGATAAYSTRKLNNAYAGSAIRVRRASDNAEQDIGFTATGDLDLTALNNFAGTTLPLDSVTSAFRAYSLRKLRTAYTGNAIRVRRSSDNSEQDIGFTLDGNLDLQALADFVGTSNGLVVTWYDQSGSGVNATQATAAQQPAIVIDGVLQVVDNRPAIKYDGADDSLRFNRGTLGDDFSILANFSTIAGTGAPGSTQWHQHAGIVDMEVSMAVNDFGTAVDNTGQIHAGVGNPDRSINLPSPGYNDNRMHWLAMTRKRTDGVFNLYTEQGMRSGPNTTTTNTNTLSAAAQISIGRIQTGSRTMNGYIPEVIVYTSVLSDADRQTLQKNAARYWNVTTAYGNHLNWMQDGIGVARAAYGLRKLRNAYAGSAIRVRRSSDNAQQDIGFKAGNLDIEALRTFVGNNSAFVTTWYDQSTHVKNLTQGTAAAQPRIVNAGTVELLNGKPTVVFDGTDDHLLNAAMTGHIVGSNVTSFVVGATNAGDWGRFVVLHKTGDFEEWTSPTSMQLLSLHANANSIQCHSNHIGADATERVTPNILFQATCYMDNTTLQFYERGALHRSNAIASNIAPDVLVVGAGRNNSTVFMHASGKLSEIVIYNNALNENQRTFVENSQLTYFVPPPQALYVTTWYDQSGNGNHLTQTNPLHQPALIMGGDGTVLNRPALLFNGSQYSGHFPLANMTSTTGFPINADYSISAVFSYRDIAPHNNIVSGITHHALYMQSSNLLTLFHLGQFANSNPTTVSINQSHAVLATYLQSTKFGSLYVGSTLSAASGTGTTANNNTNAGIQIGAFNPNPSSLLNGTISEAIVYNKVLNNAERLELYRSQTAYFGAR